MSLPSDVSVCALTFGPYIDPLGRPVFVGMTGAVTVTEPVHHVTDGTVFDRVPVVFTLDTSGSATVPLPFTDSPVLSPQGFTYTVSWTRGRFPASPGAKTFALPTALGPTAFFSHLQPAADGSGVLVPVAVGPAGPPGVADDGTVAALVEDGQSQTYQRLSEKFVSSLQLVISPTRPVAPPAGTIWINNS